MLSPPPPPLVIFTPSSHYYHFCYYYSSYLLGLSPVNYAIIESAQEESHIQTPLTPIFFRWKKFFSCCHGALLYLFWKIATTPESTLHSATQKFWQCLQVSVLALLQWEYSWKSLWIWKHTRCQQKFEKRGWASEGDASSSCYRCKCSFSSFLASWLQYTEGYFDVDCLRFFLLFHEP